MFADTFQYRVRFVNEDKNTCVIEADAPVDIDKVRAFIAKTRRVFKLAEDADIQVIELRRVVERIDITDYIEISNIVDVVLERPNKILEILEKRKRGELTALESYRAARSLFDWDDEERAG